MPLPRLVKPPEFPLPIVPENVRLSVAISMRVLVPNSIKAVESRLDKLLTVELLAATELIFKFALAPRVTADDEAMEPFPDKINVLLETVVEPV